MDITVDSSVEVEDIEIVSSIKTNSAKTKGFSFSKSNWYGNKLAIFVVNALKVDSSSSSEDSSNEFHLNLNQSGKIMVSFYEIGCFIYAGELILKVS